MTIASRRSRTEWVVESAELAAVQVVISEQLCTDGVVRSVIEHSYDHLAAQTLQDEGFWNGLFVPRLRGVEIGGTPTTALDLAVLRSNSAESTTFEVAQSFTMGVLDPGFCLDVATRQDRQAAEEVRAAMVQVLVAQNHGAFPHLQDDLLAITPVEHWQYS